MKCKILFLTMLMIALFAISVNAETYNVSGICFEVPDDFIFDDCNPGHWAKFHTEDGCRLGFQNINIIPKNASPKEVAQLHATANMIPGTAYMEEEINGLSFYLFKNLFKDKTYLIAAFYTDDTACEVSWDSSQFDPRFSTVIFNARPENNQALDGVGDQPEVEYIGNSSSKKFHYTVCNSVDDIKSKNKVEFYTREEATDKGYVPCNRCKP